MAYIYKIVSPTSRVYIGQTVDIKKRWKHYINLACKGQRVLYNSLKKYTPEKHRYEILEEVPEDKLNERETYWIDFYKSNVTQHPQFQGMNMTDGGGGIVGLKHSEEHKRKISYSLKGHKVTDNTKEKLRQANIGKKLSEETKKKIGRLGSKNIGSKLVLDTSTGIYYGCLREAAETYNISCANLSRMLTGARRNKTSLIYV